MGRVVPNLHEVASAFFLDDIEVARQSSFESEIQAKACFDAQKSGKIRCNSLIVWTDRNVC
jgi:hypothetical protein